MQKVIANPNPIFPSWMQLNPNKKQYQRYQLGFHHAISYSLTKKHLPYYNHIETSGFYNSCIIFYGANKKQELRLVKHLVFPTFRKAINDTRGSFAIQVEDECKLSYEDEKEEILDKVIFNGNISLTTYLKKIKIQRIMFSAADAPSFITLYKITNTEDKEIKIQLEYQQTLYQALAQECYQHQPYQVLHHIVLTNSYHSNDQKTISSLTILPHQTIQFYSVISCLYLPDTIQLDCQKQSKKRNDFLKQMKEKLNIQTNHPLLNQMLYFCKVRACESIFKTKNGYLHSPGGGQYYAAVWTNDQLEYTFPFFAYLNYQYAHLAAQNVFSLYQKYMYQDRALVTSIIAEGIDYWNGAKDRGDSAMYAYGISHYLLTMGNKNLAKQYIKPLCWCLDYTLSKKTKEGVIASDSDELENRFESGSVNLSTNAIAYAALVSGGHLLQDLQIENHYLSEANQLKKAIDTYFFHSVEGFSTYQYCKEEKYLRSHQCYPLICDLLDRQKEVTYTLLHSKLYTKNGFLTASYSPVFWDRMTLMAIRGLYNGKAGCKASQILLDYSKQRMLKEHVPYPIEAYPEGNQAHLAAESALYVRIFIEGILGYCPLSLHSFYLKPSLDRLIYEIEVKNITLCQQKLTITMKLNQQKVEIQIKGKKNQFFSVKNHEKILITL